MTRTPAIFDSGPIDSISSCCVVLVRSLHGLVTMPPKPPLGNVIWKMLPLSGNDLIDVVDLVGEQLRLIERRVRRRLDEAEEEALVLGRRQLLLREHVERHDQQRDDRPTASGRPAGSAASPPARACSRCARVSKRRLIQPAKPRSVSPGAQQLRAHHRRQRQRDDAGDDHRAGQRERELAEQRSGQAALNARPARRPPPA